MDLENVLRRIRAEFREMPGLRLTPAQAMRLWGLEREMCARVIEGLVDTAFLRWTRGGTIALADE